MSDRTCGEMSCNECNDLREKLEAELFEAENAVRLLHGVLSNVENALHDAQMCMTGYIEIGSGFVSTAKKGASHDMANVL